MTSWRVATFNIRHGLGPDERVDLPRLAGQIAALDADVIGLQEVDVRFGDRSDHADQAARLGELLGMQVRFGAALDLPPEAPGAPRRQYGLALLTRHEILTQQMHLLPDHPAGPPSREPRGVLHARLRHRGGEELDVLVTHLDDAAREHRTAQVQGILRLAEQIPGPAVLLGDMNADPSAPELAALSATGWRDAAQHVGLDAAQHVGRAAAEGAGPGEAATAAPPRTGRRLARAPHSAGAGPPRRGPARGRARPPRRRAPPGGAPCRPASPTPRGPCSRSPAGTAARPRAPPIPRSSRCAASMRCGCAAGSRPVP